MPPPDPYALLGVPTDASHERIRSAYELEVNRAHRDGAVRHAVELSRAYDTLSRPASRALYDRHQMPFVRERSPGAAPPPTPWRITKQQPIPSARIPVRRPSMVPRRTAVVLVLVGVALGVAATSSHHLPWGPSVVKRGVVPVELRNAPAPPVPAPADVYGPGMCLYTDTAFGSGHIARCP